MAGTLKVSNKPPGKKSAKLARASHSKLVTKAPKLLPKPSQPWEVLEYRPPSSRVAGKILPPPRFMTNLAYFPGCEPRYGPHHEWVGATAMKVIIGPQQGKLGNYGSVPQANTPRIMRDLLDSEFNAHGWVAGHLLNDNLGGPGLAKNLTPLTTAGNKNHLVNCEARIKEFIDQAYSRIEFGKDDEYWYGVRYEVHKGDESWSHDHPLLQHVATKLRVSAWVVKQHKKTLQITRASAAEAAGMNSYFAPLENVLVDNTGYENLFLE